MSLPGIEASADSVVAPLSALERRFAALVAAAGESSDSGGIVAMASAEVMRATFEGHSCLSIQSLLSRLADRGTACAALKLTQLLESHLWVSKSDGVAPLVFENDRVYLRRHRESEQRLATALLQRAGAPPLDSYPKEMDRQEVAIQQALASRLTIVTGGPGTGKTTTVARLLKALAVQEPNARVALSAPTGKAATRLGEAILSYWDRTGDGALRDRMPVSGQTLHRLLKYMPHDDRFLRNAMDQLEYDVVVVDESSMVPLGMMDALFQAVRSDARIILLGDHGQLTSVETGAVLADIVEAAATGPLVNNVVHLTFSHRFDAERGIGALARAVRKGDVSAMQRVLAEGSDEVVRGPTTPVNSKWVDDYAGVMRSVFEAETPEAAVAQLAKARVLCATNVGPMGTEAIVRRVEVALSKEGILTRGTHYHGRPILVTRNDYTLNLFNGDIGIVWNDPSDGVGGARAFVSTGSQEQALRLIPLPQLPDAKTAWAMTIHRSQGSEFDEVYIVVPDRDMPVLCRELIYTAITRAKKRVVIVGPDAVLNSAVERTTRRESGLGLRLSAESAVRH